MFTPTTEQNKIQSLFTEALTDRASLVIQAGAGTGKTSTLKMLAASTTAKGQYIAFNKEIVREGKKSFPKNVECNTAHSLAWHAIVKSMKSPMARRLQAPRQPSWEQAKFLGLPAKTIGDHNLSMNRLASITMQMVGRFCNSSDEKIMPKHCPYIEGLDESNEDGTRTYKNNNELASWLVPFANRAWDELQKENGQLQFKHDHYLKMYQLSNPKIEADFILFDEGQDANPVMQAIVANQTHATVVWVGDSQQQIYSFTGAVNALQEIEKLPGTKRAFLTQSFRFGPAVAEVANKVLDALGAELRLEGFDQIDSKVEASMEPNVYLTRTNACAIDRLMEALHSKVKVYLVGEGKELLSFARAADNLKLGKKVEHRDLVCFETWEDVLEYVESDEMGSELKLNVSLVQRYGTKGIMAALLNCSSEKDADLIVSTAHKAKGKEWDVVQIAPDFKDVLEGEELRLMYVAVTRAKLVLDISQARYFNKSKNLMEVV